MTHHSLGLLNSIAEQKSVMVDRLKTWVNINSFSYNPEGLFEMADQLLLSFKPLASTEELIPLAPINKVTLESQMRAHPLGPALRFRKRPTAPVQVFFGGHMDTVFPSSSTFQTFKHKEKDILAGPGVADMKGGLIVLLYTLLAFEKSSLCENIGWEVLINPDEEIGSIGSRYLLEEAASRNQLGLLFEPSFADGSLVNHRRGSANYTLTSKGVAAHAGRDFHLGKNAITALARILPSIEELSHAAQSLAVNIGTIEGGIAPNIVAEFAAAHINIRFVSQDDLDRTVKAIENMITESNKTDGITIKLHEENLNPPKPFNELTQSLAAAIESSAAEMKIKLSWKPSGGTCDGCRLQALGLPNIDSLGVVGGNIHTHDEFALASSLVERTQLVTLFLINLAQGNFADQPFMKLRGNKNYAS